MSSAIIPKKRSKSSQIPVSTEAPRSAFVWGDETIHRASGNWKSDIVIRRAYRAVADTVCALLIRIPAKPKKRTNQDLRLPKRVADRKRRISKYSSKRVWTTKRRSSPRATGREAAAETEDDSPENPELHEGIPTYKNNEHGLVRCKFTPDGVVNIQLTNFYARIKADVTGRRS